MTQPTWTQEVSQESRGIIDEGRDATLARMLRQFGEGMHREGAECYTDALIALAYRFLQVQNNPPLLTEFQWAHQQLGDLKSAFIRNEIITDIDTRNFCGSVRSISPARSTMDMIPLPVIVGGIGLILVIVGIILKWVI